MKKDRKKKETDEGEESLTHEILDFLKDMLISLVVVLFVVHFIVRPVQVVGHSMDPTLQDGSYGISDIIGTKLGSIDRFDIVIVYVEEKDEYIVKRAIGLPGETVSYSGGVLYINGEEMDEPFLDPSFVASYQDGPFMTDVEPITLGEDEYFCLGDNRPHSTDSRYYGPFHKDEIVAKGITVFWPLSAFGVKSW